MRAKKFVYACLMSIFLALLLPAQNQSGFFKIEPIDFYFYYNNYNSRLALRSSSANIWYTYLAADKPSDTSPLFVFFNGGPGSATSDGLRSMYTGHYTLDNGADSGGDHFIGNPYSWTKMGHLLYIDARETGLSYNTMDVPSNMELRFREFNAQNYNPFFDAADFIRVLLRFLAAHPGLQKHPVVIVAESYGGIRSTSMLYMILNYADFTNGKEMYQDPALTQELQNHFNAVFPQYGGQVVPADVIARQFGHQVLIQACISFQYQVQVEYDLLIQPGSLVFQLGEQAGIPYDPAIDPIYFVTYILGRDIYNYTKPDGWLDGFFNNAAKQLRYIQTLSQVSGYDVTAIQELYAKNRADAYRIVYLDTPATVPPNHPIPPLVARAIKALNRISPADHAVIEPGDMDAFFGPLQPWDRYFVSTNNAVNYAFNYWNVATFEGYDVDFYSPRFGRMFLKNLLNVHTLATNAAYDLCVYGPALAGSLLLHTNEVAAVSANGNQLQVTYKPDAFPGISNPGSRMIANPYYDYSCHAVSLTQPQEFYNDVNHWLAINGIVFQTQGAK